MIDDTFKVVSLGLWSEFVDALNGSEGRAVLFQNLQLREYKGKLMLSTTTNSIIDCENQQGRVMQLNSWFERDGLTHDYEELN